MSTPIRNSIAKVAPRSDDPYFDRIEIDYSNIDSGVELLKYKEIGELEVDVEVEAFLRVVSVTLVGGPKWVGTSAAGRSDIFRQWMSTVVPIHFALAFNQSFVYQAARATG